MNNQHSAAVGRNQENRLLLPIVDCQLPAFETRNWKLENRKGAGRAAETNFEFRVSVSKNQSPATHGEQAGG